MVNVQVGVLAILAALHLIGYCIPMEQLLVSVLGKFQTDEFIKYVAKTISYRQYGKALNREIKQPKIRFGNRTQFRIRMQ